MSATDSSGLFKVSPSAVRAWKTRQYRDYSLDVIFSAEKRSLNGEKYATAKTAPHSRSDASFNEFASPDESEGPVNGKSTNPISVEYKAAGRAQRLKNRRPNAPAKNKSSHGMPMKAKIKRCSLMKSASRVVSNALLSDAEINDGNSQSMAPAARDSKNQPMTRQRNNLGDTITTANAPSATPPPASGNTESGCPSNCPDTRSSNPARRR